MQEDKGQHMLTNTPTSRLVRALTDETWSRAKRNSAARLIANMRDTGNDPMTTTPFPILQSGVVGRYDRNRAELLRVIAEAGGCSAVVHSSSYHYQGSRRKYCVTLFGHRSDIDRATLLYRDLMNIALVEMNAITGTDVLNRRRQWFFEYLETVSARLHDIGAAPAASWMRKHHEDAYAARERSGGEWQREFA